jgi:ATP-dependent exoDNAse (exonuclease V) alpha subunit
MIKKLRGKTAIATISHAAKYVISNFVPKSVSKFTIAGILGMKAEATSQGELKFEFKGESKAPFIKFDNVIIDEVSMINDDTFKLLMELADAYEVNIIGVGDNYQLPPVEQDHDSLFFDNITATLTETVRFQGPIQELADAFRKEITAIKEGDYFDKYLLNAHTSRESNVDLSLQSGYKFCTNGWDMLEEAVDYFKKSDEINDTRIMAFKNETIRNINHNVREILYGSTDLSQFEDGEMIIANNTTRDPFGNVIVFNGEILKVKRTKIDFGPEDIPCVFLEVYGKDHNPLVSPPIFTVVTNDGGEAMRKFEKVSQTLYTAARNDSSLWKNYFNFRDQFLRYDYAYAINLYRAQGSTIRNAYVLDGEVMDVRPLTWKQKFQALYVAITRPSQYLTFFNENFT